MRSRLLGTLGKVLYCLKLILNLPLDCNQFPHYPITHLASILMIFIFSICVSLWDVPYLALILNLLHPSYNGLCLLSLVLTALYIILMISSLLVQQVPLFVFTFLKLFTSITNFFGIPSADEKTILLSVSLNLLGITMTP